MDPEKPIESTGVPSGDLSLSSTLPESLEHLKVIDLPGGKWQGTSAFSRTGQNKAGLWATTCTRGLLNREKGVDYRDQRRAIRGHKKYIWRSEELEAWMFLELNNCFPKSECVSRYVIQGSQLTTSMNWEWQIKIFWVNTILPDC